MPAAQRFGRGFAPAAPLPPRAEGKLLQVTHSFVAKVLFTRESLGKFGDRPICRGATMTLLGRVGYGHVRVVSMLSLLSPDDGTSVLKRFLISARGRVKAKRGRMYEMHLSSNQPLFLSESDQIPLINRCAKDESCPVRFLNLLS
jgi:hypothetical protein